MAALNPVTPATALNAPAPFGERLAQRVQERRSQLVLGLDPDPMRLWPRAIELAGGAGEPPAPTDVRAALAVSIHCALAIDAAGPYCVAVKPQVACFERLGAAGWAALREVIIRARELGLLVIADAKRGDIDVTAFAYGQAFFGSTPTPYGSVEGLGVDALTVNPMLGLDSLQPFVAAARASGGGLFVLARTSNPGATDVQARPLASGETVSGRIAELVSQLAGSAQPSGGLSDIGAVVGATAAAELEGMRRLMPSSPFLLPGIGAQGGEVSALAAAFAPGPAGGLISASRGIVAAHERSGGDPAEAAAQEAERLRDEAWKLASAHQATPPVHGLDQGAERGR